MSLTERFYEAVTGTQATRRRMPSDSVGMTRALVTRYGSNVKAARELGVSEAAVRRWLNGAKPRIGVDRLRGEYLRSQLPAGREADVRAGRITLQFTQKGERGERDRDRQVDERGLKLAPGTGDAAMDLFLAGDIRGAAARLHAGITDRWYATHIPVDPVDEDNADYDYHLT